MVIGDVGVVVDRMCMRYSSKVWADVGGRKGGARGVLWRLVWCFWWLDAAIEPYNTNKLVHRGFKLTVTVQRQYNSILSLFLKLNYS